MFTIQTDQVLSDYGIAQVMLQEEKQKADEYERKYVEAQESSEELRKKLAETEKRVYQLQDSLNR